MVKQDIVTQCKPVLSCWHGQLWAEDDEWAKFAVATSFAYWCRTTPGWVLDCGVLTVPPGSSEQPGWWDRSTQSLPRGVQVMCPACSSCRYTGTHICVRCMCGAKSIFQLPARGKRYILCVSLCDSELHIKGKLLIPSCIDCIPTRGQYMTTWFPCLHLGPWCNSGFPHNYHHWRMVEIALHFLSCLGCLWLRTLSCCRKKWRPWCRKDFGLVIFCVAVSPFHVPGTAAESTALS